MKKKHDIAIIHRSLTAGGVEKVLVNMLNEFDYSLFNIDLFLLDKDDFFAGQLNKNVNVIFEYSKFRKEKPTLKELLRKFRIFSALKVGFFFFISLFYKDKYEKKRIISKAYPMISKKKYEAIICYNGVSRILLSDSVFNFNAKKKIAWIHGDGYKDIPKKLYSFFDKIFCVSKGVKNDFLTYLPNLHKKTDIFYNLLDTKEILLKANEPLEIEHDAFIILTVARLSNEKGVTMIPEIVEKLKGDKYFFKWLLIGDGPLEDELTKTIKNKKIEDELIMLGLLKNPYNYMKMCDLYVQPSLTEGFCTTTNEVKLFCKPILVTNVNGMNEQFVNNKTAVIVDKNDANTLFCAIKRMIDDIDYRNYLSDNLRKNCFSKSNNNLKSLYLYLKSKKEYSKH